MVVNRVELSRPKAKVYTLDSLQERDDLQSGLWQFVARPQGKAGAAERARLLAIWRDAMRKVAADSVLLKNQAAKSQLF